MSILQNAKAQAACQKELDKMTAEIQAVREESEKGATAYTAAQKRYQAVCAGLSTNDDGEAATLKKQLLG